MLRLLAQTALTIIGNAIGLMMAALLLPDFVISPLGFTVSLLVFSAAQLVLAPFIFKLSVQYLPALSGGIALVTTFVSLLIASTFTNGLSVSGIATWISAPFIIWVATVVAGVLLPLVLFKKLLESKTTK